MSGQTNDYPTAVTTSGRAVTGELSNMVGGPKHRLFRLDYWVAASETLCIGYAVTMQGVPVPVAVIQYAAPLTTQALREVPLGTLASNPQAWWPRFEHSAAPGPDEVRQAWWKASRRAKVTVTSEVRDGLRREQGESPDSFYSRVAIEYRRYADTTGKPAKWIAFAGGVPVSTANRWIREARARGFLEPARKAGSQ